MAEFLEHNEVDDVAGDESDQQDGDEPESAASGVQALRFPQLPKCDSNEVDVLSDDWCSLSFMEDGKVQGRQEGHADSEDYGDHDDSGENQGEHAEEERPLVCDVPLDDIPDPAELEIPESFKRLVEIAKATPALDHLAHKAEKCPQDDNIGTATTTLETQNHGHQVTSK